MKYGFIPACNLKVCVTINIEAEDFQAAAEHQKRLEGAIAPLLEAYPKAAVTVNRTRAARMTQGGSGRRVHVASGRVSQYE
ncbi:MAG: hypothetical protein JSR45_12765 [Proteobacteria bacterium]|nr:hypothetical protein [Pseudomonadota bacterium]